MKRGIAILSLFKIDKVKLIAIIPLALVLSIFPNTIKCFQKASSYCVTYYGHPFGIPIIISKTTGLATFEWVKIILLGFLALLGNLIIALLIVSIIFGIYRRFQK